MPKIETKTAKDGTEYIPWIKETDIKTMLNYVKPEVVRSYSQIPTVIVNLPDMDAEKYGGIAHVEWPLIGFHTDPYEHRYGSHPMHAIFCEGNRLQLTLDSESGLASAHSKLGTIEEQYAQEIMKSSTIDVVSPEEVAAREFFVTKHDQVATNKTQGRKISSKAAQEIHKAATSVDKFDNADPFRIYQALSYFKDKALSWLETMYYKMHDVEGIVGAGRTHKQLAVPITHLFKFANHAYDLMKDVDRIDKSIQGIELKGFKGATGSADSFVFLFEDEKYLKKFIDYLGPEDTIAEVGTDVYEEIIGDKQKVNKLAKIAAKTLEKEAVTEFINTASTDYLRPHASSELKTAKISKQIVSRESLVDIYTAINQLVTTAEQFANEITDLQRTEIWEWIEGFDPKKQFASSAMPGKMNPINSENIKGQARILRSFAGTLYENRITAHERDLPNTAYERFVIPKIFLIGDEAISRVDRLTKTLYVNKDRIEENAHKYSHLLCGEALIYALEKKGVGRHDAHQTVREASIVLMSTKTKDTDPVSVFKEFIDKNHGDLQMTENEISETLNPENYIGLAEDMGLEVRDDMKQMLESYGIAVEA